LLKWIVEGSSFDFSWADLTANVGGGGGEKSGGFFGPLA
jgi:hypothetical protein